MIAAAAESKFAANASGGNCTAAAPEEKVSADRPSLRIDADLSCDAHLASQFLF